jgi:hypothetical protein
MKGLINVGWSGASRSSPFEPPESATALLI